MKKEKKLLTAFAVLSVTALMLTGCNAMKNMCGKPPLAAHPAGCACSQCSAIK